MKYNKEELSKIVDSLLIKGTPLLKHLDLPESIQMDIIREDEHNFKYLKNPTEIVTEIAIFKCGSLIQYVEDSPLWLQKIAIKNDYESIQYIERQSTEIQMLVLDRAYNDCDNIHMGQYVVEYFKSPNMEVIKEAFSYFGNDILKYFDISKMSEITQLELVKKSWRVISRIDNPTEDMQLEAVNQNIDAFDCIQNPTISVIEECLHSDNVISLSKHRITTEMAINNLYRNGNLIELIEDPTEELQLMAIAENPYSISHIKNPTDKVLLEVAKSNGDALIHVQREVILNSDLIIEGCRRTPHLLTAVVQVDEDLQREIIPRMEFSDIRKIPNINKNVQLLLIEQDYRYLEVINNPTKEAINLAFEKILNKKG